MTRDAAFEHDNLSNLTPGDSHTPTDRDSYFEQVSIPLGEIQ